jgi:hypothetical protein
MPLPLRVDPALAGFQVLSITDRPTMHAEVKHLRALLPVGRPTYLVLLGDLTLVDAAYANPGSLLWRDAGALLATLHLCAASFGLGFCPLGVLGNGLRAAIFPDLDRVVACGTAAVGVPSSIGSAP